MQLSRNPPAASRRADCVLLAPIGRGYGNLVRWITVARSARRKGSTLHLRSDVEGKVRNGSPMLAGLPDCLGLLIPDPRQSFETVFAHAMWLKTWFGNDRAFLGRRLLRGATTPHWCAPSSGWPASPACRSSPPAAC